MASVLGGAEATVFAPPHSRGSALAIFNLVTMTAAYLTWKESSRVVIDPHAVPYTPDDVLKNIQDAVTSK